MIVNGNGVQDGGSETGVNNVGVHLYLASDTTTAIANTTTNGSPASTSSRIW